MLDSDELIIKATSLDQARIRILLELLKYEVRHQEDVIVEIAISVVIIKSDEVIPLPKLVEMKGNPF